MVADTKNSSLKDSKIFSKLLWGIGLKYEKFWIGLYSSVCYTTTTVRLVHYLKDMDCAYSQILQRVEGGLKTDKTKHLIINPSLMSIANTLAPSL